MDAAVHRTAAGGAFIGRQVVQAGLGYVQTAYVEVCVHHVPVEADGAAVLNLEIPAHQVHGREVEIAGAEGIVSGQGEGPLAGAAFDINGALSGTGERALVVHIDVGLYLRGGVDPELHNQVHLLLLLFGAAYHQGVRVLLHERGRVLKAQEGP